MLLSKYYSVVDAYFQDNPNGDFMLPIKWNINKLSGRPNSSGFIVQHMSIQSSDSCIPSNDYFEAWLVQDGNLSPEDKNLHWDDIWTASFSFIDKDISQMSVVFSSTVYWIPYDFEEFNYVKEWKRNEFIESGDLRAIKNVDWNIEKFVVCKRHYESQRRWNTHDN